MRLIRYITLFVALGLMAGCGGSTNKAGKSFSAISTMVVQNNSGDFLLTPQAVTIDLGSMHYWRLQVQAHDSTCSRHSIGLAVKQITNPEDAKYLDTSKGTVAGGISLSSGCTGGNFTAQLVGGNYFLTVDGQPTPVTITVNSGNPSPPTTAKVP